MKPVAAVNARHLQARRSVDRINPLAGRDGLSDQLDFPAIALRAADFSALIVITGAQGGCHRLVHPTWNPRHSPCPLHVCTARALAVGASPARHLVSLFGCLIFLVHRRGESRYRRLVTPLNTHQRKSESSLSSDSFGSLTGSKGKVRYRTGLTMGA